MSNDRDIDLERQMLALLEKHGSRMNSFMRLQTAEHIAKYGMSVIGVGDNPSFTYTIGLFERFGFELITVGLNPNTARMIFNHIHHSLKEGFKIELSKIYAGEENPWANLPMKFELANHRNMFDKYAVQAWGWWDREIPIYQMVFSDRDGLLPGQAGYDHAYMDPRQTLLYGDAVLGRDFDAVSFDGTTWKAVVRGKLQRPDFQSKGAALAFAEPVAKGKRKAEPVED